MNLIKAFPAGAVGASFLVLTLTAGLAGCGHSKDAAKAKTTKQFMQQGNGKVRKPGQSGFQSFGTLNFSKPKK